MTVSAYLYPWDVDGDPAAADRIAGLGVTEVSLAAVYHAVRTVNEAPAGRRIAATLPAVTALGADTSQLAAKASAVLAAGATDLRLYHAGLPPNISPSCQRPIGTPPDNAA
jgi:hypothetical protein